MSKPKVDVVPPEAVASKPHVREAVLAITAKLAATGIGKDRTNTQQSFNFRGIDDILNALASMYVEHKIIVLPSYSNRTANEFTSKQGGRMVGVTIDGTYKLVSLVDGSELISGPFIGEAMDSGDKGTNKAMSIAYKYFAIQTFSIPVVGNEDPDFESHDVQAKAGGKTVAEKPQAVAEKPQAAAKGGNKKAAAKPAAVPAKVPENETVEQAIDRLTSTKEQMKKLTKLICDAYGVVVVDQLPAEKVKEAIARLEAYVAKAKTAAG